MGLTMTICSFKEQPPEVLLHLEAFIEVHGQNVYWWGTSDSPNQGCRGIQVAKYHWLVMTPYLKGTMFFIQILHSDVVGPDD